MGDPISLNYIVWKEDDWNEGIWQSMARSGRKRAKSHEEEEFFDECCDFLEFKEMIIAYGIANVNYNYNVEPCPIL